MSTKRSPKKPLTRSKWPAWAYIAALGIVTLGGVVAVTVAKASEPPTFSFNLSLQFAASNAPKAAPEAPTNSQP